MIKHCQSTQSNKFAILLQYLKKEVRDGVHFLDADKHQIFYKLALFFLMEVAKYVQSNLNRKLVIFLQYLKKKNIDIVYFLHADKHERFLQVSINISGCVWPDLVKVPVTYT